MTNALKTDAVKIAAFQKATGASTRLAVTYLAAGDGILSDAVHNFQGDSRDAKDIYGSTLEKLMALKKKKAA